MLGEPHGSHDGHTRSLHRLQAESYEVSVHTCGCMCPIGEQSCGAVLGSARAFKAKRPTHERSERNCSGANALSDYEPQRISAFIYYQEITSD